MMRIFSQLLLLALLITVASDAHDISYYLDVSNFDSTITAPEGYFGYLPGEHHIPYFQLIDYLKLLSMQSGRISAVKYGETYEKRPLYLFTVTSPANQNNLESLRTNHLRLSDPAEAGKVNIEKAPVVIWLGYSVHGNEASGANCVPLLLYKLAADQSTEMKRMLENTIIIIDPCSNPDGYNRFTTWVNMYRGATPVADPNHREHREVWPGGRTNHFWFDLNRDWLLIQHPETKGRIEQYHIWMPNVVNDHHEMGGDDTYFFQPGVLSRKNPLIPDGNVELNQKIAQYHAAALDSIGALYFTEEQFDDFYFGKGSTYPDLQGAIGILFEQGSSRGLVQENRFGQIEFSYSVRNQLQTSLATLKAAIDLKTELLDHQRRYFQESLALAKKSKVKAYLVNEKRDPARMEHFIELLQQHRIKVHHLKKSAEINKKTYIPEQAFLVPLEQKRYRLIQALFEQPVEFADSLFYDVSAWTMPLAFNIEFEVVNSDLNSLLGKEVTLPIKRQVAIPPPAGAYAYAFSWDDYYAPKALYRLLSAEVVATVATRPFEIAGQKGKLFDTGTIVIPSSLQKDPEKLVTLLGEVSQETGIDIHSISTGLTDSGPDLGSSSLRSLEKPEILLVIGSGISSTQAGEIWHLLDQRYSIKTTLIDKSYISEADLDRYTSIILPSGGYSDWDSSNVAELGKWIANGGTIIAFGSACRWLVDKKLASAKFKKEKEEQGERRPYDQRSKDLGAKRLPGAIFQVELDLTHPLAFGYHSPSLPVFKRGSLLMEISDNPYATPAVYSPNPLLAGYVHKKSLAGFPNSASILVSRKGRGGSILFSDDLTFRAFWYGTSKLLANAIFFGDIIN